MTGWAPSPELEIGNANIYSSYLGSTPKVMELDGTANTCIRQTIPKMPAGPVTITINYAARPAASRPSCAFIPYFNGVSLGQINPTNYNLTQKVLTSSLSV